METETKQITKRTPTSTSSQRSTDIIKKKIIQPLNKTSPFITKSKNHSSSKYFSCNEENQLNHSKEEIKQNHSKNYISSSNNQINNSIFVQQEDCTPNDQLSKNLIEYQQFQINQNQQVKSQQFQKLFDSSVSNKIPEPVAIERFDGVEASLKDSINMFKKQNQIGQQNQQNPAGTLFSFLHCFPPSTILKIIPTQQAVKRLIDKDSGKLAVVPTEVLLDMKESRQFLQGLVESQKQVIQLLQKELSKGDIKEGQSQRLNAQIRDQMNRVPNMINNSRDDNFNCPLQ